jgi:AraC-like DNA-binding protein
LNERDTIRPKLVTPRGILRARVALPAPGYARFWPADDLAPFVEHFWTVSWNLESPETHEVLPHPSVQFAIEEGDSRVVGVPRGRFTTTLSGRGRVLGTKFRPGGLRPFLDRPLSALSGRSFRPDEIFGPGARDLERLALAEPEAVDAFVHVQRFLRQLEPELDPDAELAARIAEAAASDREIVRVEALAARFGLGVRALQRLFAEYVGVSPKWVIQRYRLHEAAERIARMRPEELDGAALAADLGYADQAHFIRDFRRWVGFTPAEYARRFFAI